MSGHPVSQLMRLFGVLEGLPGMFVSSEVFRLPLLFAGTVSVCGKVVQFRGPLMIFVMGSVVVSGGHR